MSNVIISLLLDGMLAILLIATMTYCSKLSRRIRMLQDSRGELGEMIARFDQATGRASSSLAELQTVSKKIADALQLKIEKANFLADDLAFLIEKSAKLAMQLEQAKKMQPTPAADKPKPAILPRPFFEAAPVKSAVISAPQAAEERSSSSKVTASLEAVLQRLGASAVSETASVSPAGARTHAERELLAAIKSGR